MAPRAPKPKPDDADPLKPKTEKAKVEKVKPEKTAKVEKKESVKGKAEKKEKGEKTDKGEKTKAVTGDEAMELIAAYLKAQNRPYSATEVSANLHGKVTKTVADKLLKEMEQNKQIMGKATNGDKKGSQWVFWALQDPSDAATPDELATIDSAISHLRASLPLLKTRFRLASTKLSALAAAPTSSELSRTVERLRAEIEEKRSRLEGLRSGDARPVTREEVQRVEQEYGYWAGRRRARVRAFENLEELFLVGMERGELWERAGIEGDVE